MSEKRRHPRVFATFDIACRQADGEPFAAQSRDVSLGGMFVESTYSPPFGTKLTLDCRLPGAREQFSLPAIVRWTSDTGFGVQFGLLGARETHALTELMRRNR